MPCAARCRRLSDASRLSGAGASSVSAASASSVAASTGVSRPADQYTPALQWRLVRHAPNPPLAPARHHSSCPAASSTPSPRLATRVSALSAPAQADLKSCNVHGMCCDAARRRWPGGRGRQLLAGSGRPTPTGSRGSERAAHQPSWCRRQQAQVARPDARPHARVPRALVETARAHARVLRQESSHCCARRCGGWS